MGGNRTISLSMKLISAKTVFKSRSPYGSDNMTDEQRNACVEISKALGLPDKKSNWRWKRINSWKRHLISPDLGDDEYRLKIEKALDTDWSDIQEFEAGLML